MASPAQIIGATTWAVTPSTSSTATGVYALSSFSGLHRHPLLDHVLKLLADGLLQKFFSCPARGSNHLIAICDADHEPRGLGHGVRILGSKGIQLHHRRVFLKNDFPFAVGKYFQRCAFPQPERPSYLLRNHHTPQVVCLCQSGAKNFCEVPKSIENTSLFSILDFQKCKLIDQ